MRDQRSPFKLLAGLCLCALPQAAFALTVTGMAPAPSSTLTSPPTSITVTLNQSAATGTVNSSSVRLVRAGPDGILGTADDVTIVPAGITASGNTITIDLTGLQLPNDKYQITLSGTTASTTGLQAYWKLDEGAGTTTADASGNNNTGMLNSGASWTTGLSGNAVSFDGVTGAIKVTESASLEPPNGITVAMWGNITNSLGGNVADLLRKENGTGYVLRWNLDDGHLGWYIVGTGAQTWLARDPTPNSTYLNAWHHYAATYDAASGMSQLYVDGHLQGSASGGPSTLLHTDDLYLMFVNYGTQVAVPGVLDDVRIYDHALSTKEIQTLASVSPALKDSSGNVLDGEFTGTFPSGNGTAGGDFVASFTLAVPAQVTSLTPAPNAVLSATPSIVATFSNNIDPTSVDASTVQLIGAGADGLFGTADDTVYAPTSLTVSGSQLTMSLGSLTLPNGKYRLILRSRTDGAGTALNFSGGAIVGIPNFGAVMPTTEITVEFWQNAATSFSNPSTFGLNPDLGSNRLNAHVPWPDGQVFWDFGDTSNGGRLAYTPSVSLYNSWQHFAMVSSQSGNYMRIYRNGVLEASKTGTSAFVRGAYDLWIGRNGSGYSFVGQIDDFRIWDIARTQSQIQENMYTSLAGNEAGLLGYWNFNEGTGLTANDSSPNANNGTLGANGSPDPGWTPSGALLNRAITDMSGIPIDGEYTGSFPTGNGSAGGDFISEFTIAGPPIQITAPTTGSLLYTGQATAITWINNGVSGTVDLSLSTDNGATFGAPFATVPASQLSYSWTVPNASSLQCVLKVASSTNPAMFGVSGTFAIEPQAPQLQSLLPGGATPSSTVNFNISGSNLPTYSGPTGAASPVAIALVMGATTFYSSGTLTSSASSIQCTIPLTSAPLGFYDVELIEDGTVAARLPAAFIVWTVPAYIADTNGVALDGEYNGPSVASGNGAPGGNYVATFTISTTKLTVKQLTPTPGTTLTVPPTSIVVNFSKNLDATTVNANTVVITRAGPDGVVGTVDDVVITPASITVLGNNSASIDLTGVVLLDNVYQIRLRGGAALGITDSMGNLLDGDNDGKAGGDYVATFTLQRPPVANSGTLFTDEDKIAFGTLSATSPSGATLTYQIVTGASKGTVQIVPGTNLFSYVPTPGETGLDSFTFKANDGISDSNIATIAIGINAVNLTPIISSPASATPNPAEPLQDVTFTVSAVSPAGETLNYVWDFGDGTQGNGSSVTHSYNSMGVYPASVSVYGPSGAAATSLVTVTIAVFASASQPVPMSVSKLSGSVNFAHASKDTIFIQGTIPGLDSSFKPSGVNLTVNADGAVVAFTLDPKGNSKNKNGIFKLLLKPKPAKATGLPFSLKLVNGSWASLWDMTAGGRPSTLNMVVIISLNGKQYSTTVTVSYSPGSKSGKFKK